MILKIDIDGLNKELQMDLLGKVNKTYYHMPRALNECATFLRERMRFYAPSSIRNSILIHGITQQNISKWVVNVGITKTPWKDRPLPMQTASPNWRLSNYWTGVFYDQGTGSHIEDVNGQTYPRIGKGKNVWTFFSPELHRWINNYTGEKAHHFREKALRVSVSYFKQTIAEWLQVAWKW